MRQYQGFYTLACLFLKQNMVSFNSSVECIDDSTPLLAFSLKHNMVSFGQSVECMKDSTSRFALSLCKTRFLSAILHPGCHVPYVKRGYLLSIRSRPPFKTVRVQSSRQVSSSGCVRSRPKLSRAVAMSKDTRTVPSRPGTDTHQTT